MEGAAGVFSGGNGREKHVDQEVLVGKLYEQIGRLQVELDWLKKKRQLTAEERRKLIDPGHDGLSVRRQCELLGLSRSSLYYEPVPESETNLCLMRIIDELYLQHPFYGSCRMHSPINTHVRRSRNRPATVRRTKTNPQPANQDSSLPAENINFNSSNTLQRPLENPSRRCPLGYETGTWCEPGVAACAATPGFAVKRLRRRLAMARMAVDVEALGRVPATPRAAAHPTSRSTWRGGRWLRAGRSTVRAGRWCGPGP